MSCVWCFFFFKQKTAYEMRISDWSSDVCSSDLPAVRAGSVGDDTAFGTRGHRIDDLLLGCRRDQERTGDCARLTQRCSKAADRGRLAGRQARLECLVLWCHRASRSEEHTSELQSLMRISYAVFCLKKKTKQRN